MLPHNKDGFLIGTKIEVSDEAMRLWHDIRDDVADIRGAVLEGVRNQTKAMDRLARIAQSAVTAAPTVNLRKASAARSEATKAVARDAQGRFVATPMPTASRPVRPQPMASTIKPEIAATPIPVVRRKTPAVAAENASNAERDSRGRFMGTGGAGSANSPEGKLATAGNVLGRAALKISDTLAGAEQIDPAIQAANEIKSAVAPVASVAVGAGKFLFNRKKPEERQEGWLRKIWRTMTRQTADEAAYRKAEMRVLKDIDRKPSGGGGEGGGSGLLGLLSVGGGGLLGLLATIFAPVLAVGAAFFGGFKLGEMIRDWLDSVDWSAIESDIKQKWDGAVEWVKTGWTGLTDRMSAAWDTTTEWFKTGWNALSDRMGAAWDGATGWIKDKVGNVIPKGVKKAYASTVDAASRHVVEPVMEGAKKAKSAAVSVYDKAVDATSRNVIEPVANAAKWVGNKIGGAWDGAKGAVQRLLNTEGTTRVYEMADGIETRKGGTVSWRNNNPGNLKFEYAGSADKTVRSGRTKAQALAAAQKAYDGVIDLDQWGNAIFATEEAGRAAKAKLLTRKHGGKTIEEMLPHYAMSDYSGTANTGAYADGIHKLAASRGLNLRGKKIQDMNPEEFGALLDGMKRVEGFKAGSVTVQPRLNAAAVAAMSPAVAAPSPEPPAPPKPPQAAVVPPVAALKAEEAALPLTSGVGMGGLGGNSTLTVQAEKPLPGPSLQHPHIAHIVSGGLSGPRV